jgi:hypothetical protein
MRARPALVRRLLPVCFAVALLGCKSDAEPLRWEIQFTSRSLGARAALVESRILKGGCDAEEILYVSAFAPDEAGTRPPELEQGSYGLIARAQDGDCLWYAQGCTEVSLPRSGAPVRVMLAALDDETLDCDGCDAARCRGGSADMDASRDARVPIDMPDAAEPRDGGGDPIDEDGGGEPEPDSSLPPPPVVISLEPEMAERVDPPLLVLQDEFASGGAYISYPDDAPTLEENQALKRATPPADDDAGGLAFIPFEVPRDAYYRLWGRVITPSLDTDSFWLRIDDGEWLQWNDISHQDQTWHWDDVRPFEMRADRYVVPLAAGPHLLRVSYRELGSKLDRIVIASELDWVPID